MVLRGVGAGNLKKKTTNTSLNAEFSPMVYLAFPSFHRAPYHWTKLIPSYGFPNRAGKKMGTMAGTRVLCTQYLLRVAKDDISLREDDAHARDKIHWPKVPLGIVKYKVTQNGIVKEFFGSYNMNMIT